MSGVNATERVGKGTALIRSGGEDPVLIKAEIARKLLPNPLIERKLD